MVNIVRYQLEGGQLLVIDFDKSCLSGVRAICFCFLLGRTIFSMIFINIQCFLIIFDGFLWMFVNFYKIWNEMVIILACTKIISIVCLSYVGYYECFLGWLGGCFSLSLLQIISSLEGISLDLGTPCYPCYRLFLAQWESLQIG